MKLISDQLLEKKLKECSRISFSEEQERQMKQNIMASIKSSVHQESFGFAGLVNSVKKIALAVSPGQYFRTLLKEKLMTLFEFEREKKLSSAFRIRSLRKVFVGMVAFIFVVTVFFNFSLHADRAEASFLTTLDSVEGTVTVIRDDKEIPGTVGFLLKIEDAIRTGPSSRAIIGFPDQSVSRLDENTEVKISTLFVNPNNKTETIVELILKKGRLWTRVINLIDNISRFQVTAKNTVVVAKRKAAFDVTVLSKNKAKVAALQNKVDLVVATPKSVVETTLVKGFTAEMKSDHPAAPQITAQKGAAAPDQWVADNLQQDKIYIDSVKQEAQQSLRDQVNVLPGNPLYMVKQLSEDTKIALTFNDLQKQQQIFQSAQDKLAAAEVLFEKGDNDRANVLLAEFQQNIQDVLVAIGLYEANDPIEVAALKDHIKDTLSAYQKQFAVLLPTDPLYRFKEVIAKTQVLVAPNQEQKTQEKLSQAGEKLFEAHDLIEQGDAAAAKEQVQAYSKTISDVVTEVKMLPADEKAKAVSALLDNKFEDMKSLETISATAQSAPPLLPTTGIGTTSLSAVLSPFPGTTSSSAGTSTDALMPLPLSEAVKKDFNQSVSDAKAESLTNIGEAVLSVQKEEPSPAIMKKLQDINTLDVNGKTVADVRLTGDRVTITSGGNVISVGSSSPTVITSNGTSSNSMLRDSAGTTTLPTTSSKTPVLPPTRP